MARARIDAARPLPREPPSGLFTTNGSTPSTNLRSFSGNPLLDFSVASLDNPAEVTVNSTTSSTVRQALSVEVGDGTIVSNSGTITVDSEELDTTLKPKFSSPPKETKTVSFTDKKNDDSSSPEKTSTPVPPKNTPTRSDVNSSLTSEPLLSPPQAPEASTPKTSGTMLLPEGETVSFLDKNSTETIGPLLQDTEESNTTSSSTEINKFRLFLKGGLNWILANKNEDTSISFLDPLPTASTKYLALPTDFPTMPSSFESLESDAISLQESLRQNPDNFASIATTLLIALRCQQENANLNQAMHCQVRYFETRFDNRGFIINILNSIT